jgi:hypothetical protein
MDCWAGWVVKSDQRLKTVSSGSYVTNMGHLPSPNWPDFFSLQGFYRHCISVKGDKFNLISLSAFVYMDHNAHISCHQASRRQINSQDDVFMFFDHGKISSERIRCDKPPLRTMRLLNPYGSDPFSTRMDAASHNKKEK